MNYDELWPGGPRFRQAEGSFRLSTDSVLLAHFAADVRAKSVFDLGCGAGVLTVLLHVSHPDARVDGIEIQPASAALCRENLAENGFDADGIHTGDLRAHRSLLQAGAYDLVVSNPPYFPSDSGYTAPAENRAAARDERFCTLTAHGLEPKRLRTVQHRESSAPNLVLIEARRGGKPGLAIEAPLILTAPDGSDSGEVKQIYHRG